MPVISTGLHFGAGGVAQEPAPTEPAPGYTAWFDAGSGTFQDGGATPATADGDPIARWESRGGSLGAFAFTQGGGYGTCTLKLGANGIGNRAVVRSSRAATGLLVNIGVTLTASLISAGAHTVFCAYRASLNGFNDQGLWGDNAGVVIAQFVNGPLVQDAVHDGAYQIASKAAVENTPTIHTAMYDGALVYSGASDTRTASLVSVAAGAMSGAGGYPVLMGTLGPGRYLDGDLAHAIFYATALSESARRQTERYFAGLLGIALPY